MTNDRFIQALSRVHDKKVLEEHVVEATLPVFHGYRVRPDERYSNRWVQESIEGVSIDSLLLLLNEMLEDDVKVSAMEGAPEPDEEDHDAFLNGGSNIVQTTTNLTHDLLKSHQDEMEKHDNKGDKSKKATFMQHQDRILTRLKEAHVGYDFDQSVFDEHDADYLWEDLADAENKSDLQSSDSASSFSSVPAHTWSVESGQSAELIGSWEDYGISREELASFICITPLMYRFPLLIRGSLWLLSCEPYFIITSSTQGFLILTSGMAGLLKHDVKDFLLQIQDFCETFNSSLNKSRTLIEQSSIPKVPGLLHFGFNDPIDWWNSEGNTLSVALFWEWLLSYVNFSKRKSERAILEYRTQLRNLVTGWNLKPRIISAPPQEFKSLIEDLRRSTNALVPIEQLLGSSTEVWTLPVVHGSWGTTQKSIRPALARPMQQMARMLATKRDRSWIIANSRFDSLFFKLMNNIEALDRLYREWELTATEYQVRRKNSVLQMHSLVLSFDVVFAILSLVFSYGGMNIFEVPGYEVSIVWYFILISIIITTCLVSMWLVGRSLASNYEDMTRWRNSDYEDDKIHST